MNSRILIAVVAALTAAFAYSDNYIWYAENKSSSGDFNGSFTNGYHWFKGSVSSGTTGVVPPLATDKAQMYYGSGWTMSFPSTNETDYVNGVESLAQFQSCVHPGQTQTYDGSGAIFRNKFNAAANSATDSRMAFYFSPTASNSSGTDFMRTMNNYGSMSGVDTPIKTVPAWEFTDFKFSLAADASGKSMKATFEKGEYNFLNPGGYNWNKSTDMPCLYFFGANTTTAAMDKNEVEFQAGSSLKANALSIQGSSAPTNIFRFHGGNHLISSVRLVSRLNGWAVNQDRTVTDFIVDNGAQVLVTNVFQVFDNGWKPSNRVGRILVDGKGSKLTLPTMSGNYGDQTFMASDGGELYFGLNGMGDQTLNVGTISNLVIGAKNGGRLTFDHKGIGSAGKGLYFGTQATLAGDCRHYLSLDQGFMDLKSDSKINAYTVQVDFRNGSVVDNSGGILGVRGGDVAGSVRAQCVIDASTVTNRNSAQFNLGAGVAGADLLLTNGATVVYNSSGSSQFYDSTATLASGSVIDNDGGSIRLYGVADGATSTMIIDGSAITNRNAAEFAMSVNGWAHVILTNNAVMANDIDLYIGGNNGGGAAYAAAADKQYARLDIHDSQVNLLSNTTARTLRIGYRAGVKGVVNLYSGAINYFFNGTTGHGPTVGDYGNGELNIYGGLVDCFRPRVGSQEHNTYDYSQGPESVVRLYGGELRVRSQGNGKFVGFAVGGEDTYGATSRKCRLVLDGGVLTSYTTYGGKSARCHGGTGWVALEANGGKIRMLSTDSPVVISRFDEAKVGPKGLTFDSVAWDGTGYDNTVAQHVWANKDGEDGALIFVGATGSTTLTGNVEQVTYLIADGGTVNLAKLDGYALNTLIVTNGGCAILDPSKTLKVAGDIRIDATSTLKVNANVAVGQVKTLFKLSSEPSAATMAALREAVMSGRLTNLGSGRTADLAYEKVGDAYELKMTVREGQSLTIELEDNATSNATASVTYDQMDTLATAVGAHSALTLGGTYRYGAFALASGWGKRYFADLSRLQANELKLTEGVLEIGGTEPVEFAGQPVFAQSTTNNIFILKNNVAVTMKCPQGTGGQGEFMKRGAGRLTFSVDATSGYAFPGGCGYCKTANGGVWSWSDDGLNQLCFDAVSGMVATSGIPPFAVVEGELVFRGTVPNATVLAKGDIGVGLSTQEGSVQPGLVLDNVYLKMDTHPHNYFTMGAAVDGDKRTGDFVTDPYLILTNNARLSCAQFFIGRYSKSATMQPRVEVVDSWLDTAYFCPGDAAANTVKPRYVFRNATLNARTMEVARDVEIVFDNTLLARRYDYATNPDQRFVALGKIWKEGESYTGTYTFRNGSQVYLGKIAPTKLNVAKVHPFRLIFDDSDWYPTNDVGTCTLAWADGDKFELVMTNKGVRLTVPASNVWTLNQPLIGTGGMIKKGEGSLKFGADCVQFAGTARIESGDIDCAEAGTIAGLAAGGPGMLKNVTASRFTLNAPYAAGAVAEPLTVNGLTAAVATIDLGCDATPIADPTAIANLVVGKYAGTAPTVSRWRLTGTGSTGLKGTVEMSGGNIVLKKVEEAPGMLLLVR